MHPDNYYWTQNNITSLCTTGCQQSAKQWDQNVATACAGYNITLNSKSVPIETVSGRYLAGLNVACLPDGSGGNCLLDSQSWVGSDLYYNSDGSPADYQPMTSMYSSSLVCPVRHILYNVLSLTTYRLALRTLLSATDASASVLPVHICHRFCHILELSIL